MIPSLFVSIYELLLVFRYGLDLYMQNYILCNGSARRWVFLFFTASFSFSTINPVHIYSLLFSAFATLVSNLRITDSCLVGGYLLVYVTVRRSGYL